jgi:predicted RNA-binding protein with PUA-like domain
MELLKSHCSSMSKKYWLMKSEPSEFSIKDLKSSKDQTAGWDGVRNYQARNFMMNDMSLEDEVLFYHSNCDEIGVVGVAKVVSAAYPDSSAWDKKSKYYDPKSSKENPRWFRVDIKWVKDFSRTVTLQEIKDTESLSEMKVVQRGQRLSIQPVNASEFSTVCELGGI